MPDIKEPDGRLEAATPEGTEHDPAPQCSSTLPYAVRRLQRRLGISTERAKLIASLAGLLVERD